MLDMFKNNGYSAASLTAAINKLPFKPGRIGEMGLFVQKGVTTTTALIEDQQGKLALLPTQARGANSIMAARPVRTTRALRIPHIPMNDELLADHVQGIRKFGTEDQLEDPTTVVNDRLEWMRQCHEVTHEYHRIGALQGNVLDADGSTVIYNLFTEFGITEQTVDFDFTPGTQNMKTMATAVIRIIENALGATPYQHIHAFCGDTFWDSLISHATVAAAFDKWQDGQFLRDNQLRTGFDFAGITWENYRGSVGGTAFFPATQARFFPVGVPDMYQHIMAPANFIEAVNTIGKVIYAKQEPMPMGMGINMHTQSNPLLICTRPKALVKGF